MNVRRAVLAALGGLVLLCLLVAVAVTALSVKVEGSSMAPTLHDGDRLLAVPGSAGEVHRFDVVLLRSRHQNALLVKRVIALPGDRIAIVSTAQDPFQVLLQERGRGPVYRVTAGQWIAQARRTGNCCAEDGTRSARAALRTVPAGSFFYLGDNPDLSDDSRAFGWGEIDRVEGRVGLRGALVPASAQLGARPVLEESRGTVPGAGPGSGAGPGPKSEAGAGPGVGPTSGPAPGPGP
ncbi:signal peptidase I [Streptomyces sp. NPDC004327]|uniref:signal peptidase I n=1 Tax=Streptomyces sp. NPDC004327 TaxID=3364699 RepID=UPI0036847A27